MSGENPQTPREWALLACAQWGRAEYFPGVAFTELVDIITLAVEGAAKQERGREREACARSAEEVVPTPMNLPGGATLPEVAKFMTRGIAAAIRARKP